MEDTPSKGRRLVKPIRDKIGHELATSKVVYEPIPKEQLGIEFRKKLAEEVAEYMVEPCVEELADVYAVIEALAEHELGITMEDVIEAHQAKIDDRGGFKEGLGMYTLSNDELNF